MIAALLAARAVDGSFRRGHRVALQVGFAAKRECLRQVFAAWKSVYVNRKVSGLMTTGGIAPWLLDIDLRLLMSEDGDE